MPLNLSIIIPTKNRLETLKEVIESIKKQKDAPSFELIIIDDGSEDQTSNFLKNLKLDFPFYFELIKPSGPAKARNIGIDKANGKVVLFFGDDTILHERCLYYHFLRQKENDFSCAIIGRIFWHSSIKVTYFMDYINEWGLQFGFQLIEDPENVPFNFFYTSNISIPKKFLKKEKFDETFPYAAWEDIELSYRLNKAGLRLKYRNDAIVYHKHPTNIKKFLERQYKSGISASIFYKKHPELGNFLGIPLAKNLNEKKSFYLKLIKIICIIFENTFIPVPNIWYKKIMEYNYLKGIKDSLNPQKETVNP
jgi:glycosyltransferase involved in cell wall biosynthesis